MEFGSKRKPMAWYLFEYKGQKYSVVNYCIWKENGEIRFINEPDGVRECGHDYAATIHGIYKDFPNIEDCEPNPIELINWHFLNEDLLTEEYDCFKI